MVKGLQRSLSRGAPLRQEIVRQRVTFSALALTVDGATGVGFGSAVIGDLPEGNILFLGATAYVQFDSAGGQAGVVDDWDGDFAIGTTPASDGTLSGADVDIIPSTATTQAVGEDAPRTRGANATAVMLDNTDGSLELNLSLLIDDADISADDIALTATGELELVYVVLGDD